MSEQRSDMDGRPAAELPPQVRAVPEGRLLQYWKERERQHVRDVYAGLRIKKFPEDLRMFEHLLWLSRAQVVVELGTHLGGSALWFRDRLRTLAAYGRVPEDICVVTVDTAQDRVATLLRNADPYFDKDIVLVEADVTDPGVTEAVSRHVPSGARCLVVEDTAHTYRTTYAALQLRRHRRLLRRRGRHRRCSATVPRRHAWRRRAGHPGLAHHGSGARLPRAPRP
ncbi:CmcI family methyltransferase [Streptomyces sp. H62]